jgi:hypothetical protein
MRIRLNIELARSSGVQVNQFRGSIGVVLGHVFVRAARTAAKKEKPGGGNAGLDFVVIGVYGFKYAAWLSFIPPESGESVLFFLYSQCSFLLLLFSCSSITFLNLTEAFANSHRFLLVCALTRPWVGRL